MQVVGIFKPSHSSDVPCSLGNAGILNEHPQSKAFYTLCIDLNLIRKLFINLRFGTILCSSGLNGAYVIWKRGLSKGDLWSAPAPPFFNQNSHSSPAIHTPLVNQKLKFRPQSTKSALSQCHKCALEYLCHCYSAKVHQNQARLPSPIKISPCALRYQRSLSINLGHSCFICN